MKTILKPLIILIITITNSYSQKLTKAEIFDYLYKKDCLFIDVTLQIIYTETGHLKYVKNNNLFGFRVTKDYMKFKSYYHCLDYYISWQNKKYPKFIETTGKTDYYEFICWVGWKDGKRCSEKGRKYVSYIKRVSLNF